MNTIDIGNRANTRIINSKAPTRIAIPSRSGAICALIKAAGPGKASSPVTIKREAMITPPTKLAGDTEKPSSFTMLKSHRIIIPEPNHKYKVPTSKFAAA